MIISIDGIEYDVENKQLAQAIKNQQSAHDAEKEEMKKKFEKADEEKEEMKKEKDKAEAAKDSMLADAEKFSDDAIKKMVTDKALLLTQATAILGDKMPECKTCDTEIKAAVIDHVDGKDVSGKSDDYIQAMYDMAVEKATKAKGSVDDLNKDFQKDSTTITRESAQRKYVADHLGGN